MLVFLWEVVHEKIMVNVQRFRRGWINLDLCMSCGTQSESVLHVLRDCNFIKGCWLNLLPASEVQTFFGFVDIREWLSWCLKSSFCIGELPWPVVFMVTVVIRVAWIPAAMGWITINSSVRQNSGAATCASSFRDSYGKWLLGFRCVLRVCGVVEAKLWAIYHALNVAWIAVQLLQGQDSGVYRLQSLIINCRALIRFRVVKIYREANMVADYLASSAHGGVFGMSLIDLPSSSIKLLLDADCMNVFHDRIIN
ncbi:hypothetical protein MANES_04G057464v8 [Manihot esculenta]|uniref:Uncharacterized protein n=1 Tax=Manihot esculenta TaxID=3983 RepID=A0ACB7HS45_MANES|nr:hypothetical protein MANES_04G057464v8 [Manihot esculenta]